MLPAMSPRTLALALAVAAAFVAHALFLSGLAEDAFITFRYAQNLVDGHGLVWNPGDPPVEGYTNFSWLLMSALLMTLGLDPELGSQALGLAASLVTLAYTWRCGVHLLGWSPAVALLPCAMLAVSGPFASWASGGLETNFFGALLVAGVYHYASYERSGERRTLFACFGALLLSALTRPEGVLVYALVLGLAVAASGPARSARLRDLAAPVGLTLLLGAVYFAWRWSYFGYPLPNTFYAKTGGSTAQYVRGARYAGLFALHFALPWAPLLALAWLRRGDAVTRPAAFAERLRAHALLCACALVTGAWSVYVMWVGGDYMAMYRFFVPALPFLYLLIAAAAARVVAPGPAPTVPVRALAWASLALGLLGTLVHSTPLERSLFAEPRYMHGNYRGVQKERWHAARLATLGHFFAGYAAGPEESLATDAIGIISYHSGLRVYGAHGLVDPAVAHEGRGDARIGSGFAGHERHDLARLLEKRPTFVMFTRELKPARPTGIAAPEDMRAIIAREYRLESVWLEDPRNGEAGWFNFLERRDRAPR